MLDSIYHMSLNGFENFSFGMKPLGFCHMLVLKASFHKVSRKSVSH